MNQPQQMKFNARMIVEEFFIGFFHQLLSLMLIRLFPDATDVSKMLDAAFTEHFNFIISKIEAGASKDLFGYMEIKKMIQNTFDLMKKSILEEHQKLYCGRQPGEKEN